MTPGVASLNYTEGYQHDLGCNCVSKTAESVGGRLESSFDSATGITTRYTYKPDTNYVQEVKTTNSAGTVLADDSYTYRADGRVTVYRSAANIHNSDAGALG